MAHEDGQTYTWTLGFVEGGDIGEAFPHGIRAHPVSCKLGYIRQKHRHPRTDTRQYKHTCTCRPAFT
eukprot:44167-Eustigmatos_ZCMA.PRE.1